ncbi:MAG: leucyl/phenylalanyl-tRNA--protein transferase [Flavobacteriales bacterium]|nr:leucyl/phenylalanyl-tRNA--protein transferase [Flavobacteriales bacterium]
MLGKDAAPLLTPSLLLAAYRQGFFPMTADDGTIEWHNPDPRAVFPLESIRPNNRLQRHLRSASFDMRLDTAFQAVMEHCATVHGESWISPGMVDAYTELHRSGHAHSVETWHGGSLVGGIYGVGIGAAFFGESMFSLETNASKAAFHHLAAHLRNRGFQLFDTQYANPHTSALGAVEIPRREFLDRLAVAVIAPVSF